MKRYSAEDIERWGSCPEGVEFAKQYAPNGFTIPEFLALKEAPSDYIHWVFERIISTEEELALYTAKMNIVNSKHYYYAENIENCEFIVKSKNIKNCTRVFSSKQIENSTEIAESEDVENSSIIFNSTFINNGTKIDHSSNIANASNVYRSFGVVNSKNIFESTDVFGSYDLIRCNSATNCYFCVDCSSIANCMFCSNITDAEYHIFNKPVTKERYEFFVAQYQKYWNGELAFIEEWPSDLTKSFWIRPTLDFSKWYAPIPEKFWKWTKTLPGYDSFVLYEMTMLPEILIGQQ